MEILEWRIEEGIHEKKDADSSAERWTLGAEAWLAAGMGGWKAIQTITRTFLRGNSTIGTNQIDLDVETCNRKNDIPGRTTDGIRKP